MPRIIGIFAAQSVADEVVEQLELNGIDRTTVLCSPDQLTGPGESTLPGARAMHAVHLPEKQAAEYRARLQQNQCLLLVEVSALDLPTVQRLLRNAQPLDIDVLPESAA
jgi:hypothetical protein